MQKHIVICDRCGDRKDMHRTKYLHGVVSDFKPPYNWGEDDDWGDYCPKCLKEYKKHMDRFV